MGWRIEALKAAVSGRPEGMQRFFSSRMTSPPDRNTQEFLESYAHSPRLSPVTKIATDLSNVEGKLFRILRNGERDEITDHPFLDFMQKPNPLPFMTRTALWRLLETYLLIKGEGSAAIERDAAGYPAELWPMPSHWTYDIPRLDYPFYRVRNQVGQQTEIPPEDMFLIRQLNPLNPYGRGLGDAEPIADEIETDEYMAKWAKKFFFNDATPPVLVSAPGLRLDEYSRFESTWNDKFRGTRNAHKFGIIPREIDVKRLIDSQREMDFAESRKFLRDAANAHFGVPPEILGIVENSNRATATQSKIIYAENVLTPRLLARQDAINNQLLPAWGDDLLWEFDDIVPEDVDYRLEMSNAGLSGSAIMVDEWREANGWDPLPGGAGKVLYVPFASVPTKPEDLTESVREDDDLPPLPGVKSGKRRLQTAKRDRARLLIAEERNAARNLTRFFNAQLTEIVTAMQTGHKSKVDDFWTRIFHGEYFDRMSEGQGLTTDVSALRATVTDALSQLVDWETQDETLLAALNPIWVSAFEAGAKSTGELFGIQTPTPPKMTDYMRQQGLTRVKDINATTRDALASALADGIEAGESTAQLVKRIQQHMPDVQSGRAAGIAASETHTCLQGGSFSQMQFGGVRTKTWVTAGDGDVRSSHKTLNRVTIPIEQRFPNDLLYPGDPAGEPREVIRCRCDLLPGDF